VVAICTVSDVMLIVAGVAGIGSLVTAASWVLTLVRWLGVGFLAWYGVASLLRARRFVVRGDVVFEAGVVVTGDVEVQAAGDQQVHIADGTVLEG